MHLVRGISLQRWPFLQLGLGSAALVDGVGVGVGVSLGCGELCGGYEVIEVAKRELSGILERRAGLWLCYRNVSTFASTFFDY